MDMKQYLWSRRKEIQRIQVSEEMAYVAFEPHTLELEIHDGFLVLTRGVNTLIPFSEIEKIEFATSHEKEEDAK